MPEIVRMCHESWCMLNPDYEITFLDNTNLKTYLKIEDVINNDNLSPQVKSNIVRIELLKNHGGVWVDATCYCMKPLSSWLDECTHSGFFAFSNPGPDRMLSNWFLVAEKGNLLTEILTTHYRNHFKKNRNIKLVSPKLEHRLKRIHLFNLLEKRPTLWLTFPFTKILAVYPYFCFHYTFEKLYNRVIPFKKIWDHTPKISADIPHQLQFYGLNNTISEGLKHEIDTCFAPLYKLTHKVSLEKTEETTTYGHLVKHHIKLLNVPLAK